MKTKCIYFSTTKKKKLSGNRCSDASSSLCQFTNSKQSLVLRRHLTELRVAGTVKSPRGNKIGSSRSTYVKNKCELCT